MFTDVLAPKSEWIVKGICAYVPQVRYLTLQPLLCADESRLLGYAMLLSKVCILHSRSLQDWRPFELP